MMKSTDHEVVGTIYRVHCQCNIENETYCGWIEEIEVAPLTPHPPFWLALPNGTKIPGAGGDCDSLDLAKERLDKQDQDFRHYYGFRKVTPEAFEPPRDRRITCRTIEDRVLVDWETGCKELTLEEAWEFMDILVCVIGMVDRVQPYVPPQVHVQYLPPIVDLHELQADRYFTGEEASAISSAIAEQIEQAMKAREAASHVDYRWQEEGF